MVAGGYGIGLTVNILETRWILEQRVQRLSFAQANISYDLGRLAMTIGHLGAARAVRRSGILPWLRRAFAAVGQMAVTNYLTHSVVALIIFVFLGYYGQLERHQLYYVVLRDLGRAAGRQPDLAANISASARSNGCGAI